MTAGSGQRELPRLTATDQLPVAATGVHSDVEMVLLSRSSPSKTSSQREETQARANEQLVIEGSGRKTESPPEINPADVADRVYRLMQRDLILERERATRVGG